MKTRKNKKKESKWEKFGDKLAELYGINEYTDLRYCGKIR